MSSLNEAMREITPLEAEAVRERADAILDALHVNGGLVGATPVRTDATRVRLLALMHAALDLLDPDCEDDEPHEDSYQDCCDMLAELDCIVDTIRQTTTETIL